MTVQELRSGAWGVTWADFIAMVKNQNAPPVPPIVPETSSPSDWAREAWAWAMNLGTITDGSNPKNAATREQIVTMLYNFSKLK